MKYAIVCTTIFIPKFLESYCRNIEKYGHKESAKFYIIPDKKTPQESSSIIDSYRNRGFKITYPDMPSQDSYLDKFPALKEKIPYNSDNRRNIGYLMAYEDGADVIISIDDDNYPLLEFDFISAHSVCGKSGLFDVLNSKINWYNICELLEINPSVSIFPRGFPYRVRKNYENAHPLIKTGDAKIGMNAGLWTDDPDVDAITRNFSGFKVIGWKGKSIVLSKDTWSPINTQNTSLIRELLPAFYYVRMGFDIGGTKIDRFGDILAGYFCQKVAKSLGYSVRVGDPICEHRRTPHNLFDDLYHEWAGIVLIEDVTLWLENVTIEGRTATQLYLSLADKLARQADVFDGYMWSEQSRGFLKEISDCMVAWIEAINNIDLGK